MTLFKTKRTLVRAFQRKDLDALVSMMTDPEMMKFTGFRKALEIEKIESLLEKWIEEGKQKLGVWAVETLDDGDLVGWFMLKETGTVDPELGFMISKGHWNEGYACEVSLGFLNYGFSNLKLEKIIASTVPTNTASIHVLEKIGMTEMKDQISDVIYYEIKHNSGLRNHS